MFFVLSEVDSFLWIIRTSRQMSNFPVANSILWRNAHAYQDKLCYAFTHVMKTEDCTSISKSLMFKELERLYKDLTNHFSMDNPISASEFQALMKKDEFNIVFFSKLYTRWIMSTSDKKEFGEIIKMIDDSVADVTNNGVFYLAGHEHTFITGKEKGNVHNEKSYVVDELKKGFAIASFEETVVKGAFSTKITYEPHKINKK